MGKGADDDDGAKCLIAAVVCALAIYIGGGLVSMTFASCPCGSDTSCECSRGVCWWGCDCTVCPVGSGCSGYIEDCSDNVCERGTFSGHEGSKECIDCDPGTFCDHDGCGGCAKCAEGAIAPDHGTVECV